MKKLITERDIEALWKDGIRELRIGDATLLTPSAKDRIISLKIKLIREENQSVSPRPPVESAGSSRLIVIGSDHTGYRLKKILIEYLRQKGYKTEDEGTYSEESCDYPDFAFAVAKKVLTNEYFCGICIDATGIPSAITANKVPGIRAAACFNEFTARSAREHNNANILALGGKTIGEETAKSILDIWLGSLFQGGRHQKRLDKIRSIEEIFFDRQKR